MRVFAIGDIHGCARTTEALLERISPDSEDHLIFIGDYVDRGPDSRRVISRLIRLRDECRCTFLRGNHEAMMLDFIDHNDLELWRINGGMATLESYRTNGRIRVDESHIEFVRNTLLYYNADDFFFVHAGLKPQQTIEENVRQYADEVFLWERSHLMGEEFAWEKPVVCGHTPQRSPIDKPLLICIDTGCVYRTYPGYGYLTAVSLPDREMIHVAYAE